jgi:RNA polymerase sigma-70 factor (ECF subfamily)
MSDEARTNCDDPADEFIHLLLQHKSQLLGYIFCMVRNLTDAEDVFQQMSLTLWDKFGDFVPGTSFVAWAKVVARNKALTFLRSQRRERARFSDDVVDLLADRELWSPDAVEERIAALVQCRQKLSKVDQALLSDCYGTANAFRDVAERLGRSVDSVYSSLSRIRRALYDCIQRTIAKAERA